MITKLPAYNDGSKGNDALKNEPFMASVRRFHPARSESPLRWVAFKSKVDRGDIRPTIWFTHGVLVDVTLNGDADEKQCGATKSTADATGLLHMEPVSVEELLEGVTYNAHLKFDPELRSFVIAGTKISVTSCDYLVLQSDGKATFCWRNKPTCIP